MLKAFYQSVNYEPIRDRAVRRTPPSDQARVGERRPHLRTLLLEYFQERSFERVGVLHGEYLVHPSGVLLIDREGFVTAASVGLEDPAIRPWLLSGLAQFHTDKFAAMRSQGWDDIAVSRNVSIFGDAYEINFFHFCLELVPRGRYFPKPRNNLFVTPKTVLAKPFQRDLLQRCLGEQPCHVLEKLVRLRDPIVAHDQMSEEGISWLREASRICVPAGKRRIYIRRAAQGTRSEPGGGVAETPQLLKFLIDNGFECVDFGNGDLGVAAQAALLEGAGIVISAHSAGLSNIAYLEGEVGVVEIFGPRTLRGMYMHLALTLGFRYYGLISGDLDAHLDIVVDLEELSEALRFLGA